jgi:hydroxymethylglutaryl-CoA lyase
MSDPVTIIECPRDAFQGLPRFIPTETKVDYLLSLIEAGFRHIDFGSFVSPRAVPQMQDTQQVADALRPYLKKSYLIAIIPNVRGLEKVIQAGGIRCAGYPLSISNTFQQRNLHQDLEQSWKIVDDLIVRARAAQIDLIVYLSMAFGNPYDEAWSADRVATFVEKLVEKGIQQISLADTVGLAKAQEVHDVFLACLKNFPEIHFGAHLHSRPERWEEPVLAAYEAGCRRFDGALHGIGGCPFAEDELVGNIPTERVIHHFNQIGIDTGLNELAIQKPLVKAREILGQFGKDGKME